MSWSMLVFSVRTENSYLLWPSEMSFPQAAHLTNHHSNVLLNFYFSWERLIFLMRWILFSQCLYLRWEIRCYMTYTNRTFQCIYSNRQAVPTVYDWVAQNPPHSEGNFPGQSCTASFRKSRNQSLCLPLSFLNQTVSHRASAWDPVFRVTSSPSLPADGTAPALIWLSNHLCLWGTISWLSLGLGPGHSCS